MRNLKKVLLLILAAAGLMQGGVARGFKLQGSDSPAFLGNAIVDILVHGDRILASTGFGLNVSYDYGNRWQSFTPGIYPGKGGVSAMGYMDDNTLWIATAFDTTADGQNFSAGGGLSYTRDGGKSWVHIPQPVDSVDETGYAPTTTNIQNITFDIAFLDSTVWIASFGGGLRRSDDMGKSWQVVTTDGQPFNSLNNLSHRAFSLMTENGNIWYGSAEGISKSTDGGQSWERFTHQNQERPISGNFVVALAWQEATKTVWAATIEAVDGEEVRAVSKSEDGGQSWDTMLTGVFAHNFGFDGETVFVASDLGLYVSDDRGANWYELPPVIDSDNGEKVLDREYFSAASQTANGLTRWWLGSGDGLVSTTDHGNTWRITRSFVSTRQRTSPRVYAYPSPFSPPRGGYTRFQFDISADTAVEIKIYNWAMEHVRTLNADEGNWSDSSRDRSVEWDGRDIDGRVVDSGVYFFRADIGGTVTWGKVVVID